VAFLDAGEREHPDAVSLQGLPELGFDFGFAVHDVSWLKGQHRRAVRSGNAE
jgi:hypothetical protein